MEIALISTSEKRNSQELPREPQGTSKGTSPTQKLPPFSPSPTPRGPLDLDSCRAPPKNAESHAKISGDLRHSTFTRRSLKEKNWCETTLTLLVLLRELLLYSSLNLQIPKKKARVQSSTLRNSQGMSHFPSADLFLQSINPCSITRYHGKKKYSGNPFSYVQLPFEQY